MELLRGINILFCQTAFCQIAFMELRRLKKFISKRRQNNQIFFFWRLFLRKHRNSEVKSTICFLYEFMGKTRKSWFKCNYMVPCVHSTCMYVSGVSAKKILRFSHQSHTLWQTLAFSQLQHTLACQDLSSLFVLQRTRAQMSFSSPALRNWMYFHTK